MLAKVIAVANQKDGVGKTTIAVQISLILAERGHKVCLVDNDPSGDATTALLGEKIPDCITKGSKPEALANTIKLYTNDSEFDPYQVNENLFLMGSTDALSMFNGAEMESAYEFCDSVDLLKTAYDFIIIDSPPSFGLLFTTAILASENGGVIVPLIPDDLSFKAAKKVHERIGQMNHRMRTNISILGVIPNKVVNNPVPQSVRHYLEASKECFSQTLFETCIHQTVKISDAIALDEKVSDYAKPTSKASLQLNQLTDEILSRMMRMEAAA